MKNIKSIAFAALMTLACGSSGDAKAQESAAPGDETRSPTQARSSFDDQTAQDDSCMCSSVPGPRGAEGPEGPAGPAGLQGPAGPKGDKGDTGTQGIQGSIGPQGPQGDQGPAGPAGSIDTGGIYVVETFDTVTSPPIGAYLTVDAECDPGDIVISGGCRLTYNQLAASYVMGLSVNAPNTDRTSWDCQGRYSGGPGAVRLTATAICAQQ